MTKEKYGLMKELVEALEQYDGQRAENARSLKDFGHFLISSTRRNESIGRTRPPEYSEDLGYKTEQSPEMTAGILIGIMYKYAKHYTKKALENNELNTLDEFTFMATLMSLGEMTKSELIRHNLLELTSGTEVIRRLHKSGFIRESLNEADKRSKKIALTERGRQNMIKIYERMTKVAFIINGPLDEDEKNQLVTILKKLQAFHEVIYRDDLRSDINEIVHKYVHF